MTDDPIVIVSYARTPMGNLLGALKDVTAVQLGAAAIQAAIQRAELEPADVDAVLMGCVLQAGLGQAPARQAAIAADIPVNTSCATINKVCGSGMKAIMLAQDMIFCGHSEVIIAGGMECMTNAPYLLQKARQGYRAGHDTLVDHMYLDGLEDAYDKTLMGLFAERTAQKYHFTREAQDAYAIESLKRAQKAAQDGTFEQEIAQVEIQTKKGTKTIAEDDGPKALEADKVPKLKPAFSKEGTITAASASSISDGAAALLMMRLSEAEKLNLKPKARLVAQTEHAQDPEWFAIAPTAAVSKLLQHTGWAIEEVDLFEINEAFAVTPMVVMKELDISHEKMNVHGGACVLGHPIGASGARILVTLLNALERHHAKRGIASLCIGGGEATAVAVERL